VTSFLLSPAAVHDLEEIAAYVAAERASAVGGVLDTIEAACRLVAEYPSVGRARDEIDEGVRSFPVGAYVLFYYVDAEVVGIARILHARRDIAAAFHLGQPGGD
jgi:toxin ParE1/3/4